MKKVFFILSFSLILLILIGCSTTSKLDKDEILYTGVKDFDVTTMNDSLSVPSGVKDNLFDIINVKPNNSLYSPYYRTPFPIGLWVYNHINADSKNGFKHWIYDKFAEEPVLMSDVRPNLRMEMISTMLTNNGYFGSDYSYKIIPNKKNPKKAKINYYIELSDPYLLSKIELLKDSSTLVNDINAIAKSDDYLQTGSRYSVDSLSMVRARIANVLRNRGYYFFQPTFIEFLADSTITPQRIALRMTLVNNIQPAALKKYYTGSITTIVNRSQGGGTPDTIPTRKGELIQMQPSHLRKNLIPSCITFRTGKVFSVRDMNRTQAYLSRLGIFNAISINTPPIDSLANKDSLDVMINCVFDAPMETSIEMNATTKSSNYIGPALTFGLTHNNLFGGAERLSVDITAAYEWMIGGNKTSSNNSYEFGISTSLLFPRVLVPKFIKRSRNELNWTRITLSADLLNRPGYFKIAKFETSYGYEWHTNKHSFHQLKLFKLTFNKPLKIDDAAFETIFGDNTNSYNTISTLSKVFIPAISYTYTYDNSFGYRKSNTINWSFTVSEASNLIAAISGWPKKVDENKLFGTPYSQFVKGQTQLVYGRRLYGDSWLVSRVLVGIAHAYGNSEYLPFTEEFYIGGANSLRAFATRSIGPGNFNPNKPPYNGVAYYSQGGTFKFEFNVEYRFPLMGPLKGAFFVDTGNIWNLKDIFLTQVGTTEEYVLTDIGKLKGSTFFDQLALDVGFGLRFDLQMLVLRADLGFGIHYPYDNGKSGYYNMTSFRKSLGLHLAIGYPF